MDQDWTPVVLTKKKPTGSKPVSDEKAVTAARRDGNEVETMKKFNAGANKKSATTLNTAKLDAETDDLSLPKVSKSMADSIRDGRMAKKLTQKQLAQAINEQQSVIADYESGKGLPNGQVISKIEKALGIKIPRPPKAKKAAE
mmetsp:Transcript_13689/g.23486  ORF Transcript_13689/g.23486 Transcript_13689/m.23486 type:complete len:143 (+) Transcript_13689:108-536(+)|eukprot:CAMPEP_0196653318 /NCGR_PEP_ID=MMETSP1086-20130531/2929_1 /TAXON_ID=77921 /ORGANISM="Cyanoptyche  gloeocystis , Strain SAG4.97" /LENGTH=142 /DNA_ID=CAMNT_0041984453 /DNA_START=98 /DNA_END=526 /DNA_ORIENTATION=-